MSTLSDKIDKILSDKTDLIVIDGVKSAEGGAADLLKLLAIRPDVNPEEYLRIALDIGARYSGISDREEFDNIKINSDVFITGPYCLKLLSDTEDRKDSTCDLTQRAAVSGLGVGYYARIFIKLTDYHEGQFDRILLIT